MNATPTTIDGSGDSPSKQTARSPLPEAPSTPRNVESRIFTTGDGRKDARRIVEIGEIISNSNSTPFGKSTQNRMPLGSTVEDMKDTLLEELGGIENIPVVELSWARGLYKSTLSDTAIRTFLLKPSSGYTDDGDSSRWGSIPVSPKDEDEIYPAVIELINTVLSSEELMEAFGPAVEGVTRTAIDTNNVFLHHSDQDLKSHNTRPDISILAHGPSFQVPLAADAFPSQIELGIGFSNVASVFDVKLNRKIQMTTKHTSQMGTYARQILIQQPNRNFVRLLIITETSVRLFHFDRSGCFMTPYIDYHRDPCTFVRFIVGLASRDEKALGLDTSVQWDIKNGRKISGTITVRDAKLKKDIVYDLDMEKPPFIRSSIRGRGTTCWYATDQTPNKNSVVVKDNWRNAARHPEHKFLEAAQGIPGISTLLCHQNTLAQTRSYRPSKLKCADFSNRTKCRLVVPYYGRSLIEFTSRSELIGAIKDIILAHRDLLMRGILHRDITLRNILLGAQGAAARFRAFLIDLDMSIYFERKDSEVSVDRRTICSLYQSVSLLLWNYESCPPPHDYMDDLESIFFVLCHVVRDYKMPGAVADGTWLPAPMKGQSLAQIKDIFVSGTRLRASTWWGKPTEALLSGYQAILAPVIRAKRDIHTNEDLTPAEKVKELQALTREVGDVYETLEALFDTALAEISAEDAAAVVAASIATSSTTDEPVNGSTGVATTTNHDEAEQTGTKRPRPSSDAAGAEGSSGSAGIDADASAPKRLRRSSRIVAKSSAKGKVSVVS